MSVPAVLAASASSDASIWSDLLEVIGLGLGAGVGIAIAFSLALRGLIRGAALRRDGNGAAAAAQYAMGTTFGVLCIAAVGLALVTMLHR